MIKKSLCNICSIAKTAEEATNTFAYWCKLLIETGIKELKTMAKTITQRFDGVVAFFYNRINLHQFNGWI